MDEQLRESRGTRKRRQWVFVWVAPLIWLGLAGASTIYRGGEFMALAVALLPAILLDKLTGFPGGLGNEFGFAIAVGFPVVAIVASVLDLARVSVRTFALSFCIGILAVQGIVLGAFVAQVNRSSYQRAYSLFDFDQPDRLVAWQILCGSMGLYFSVPIALLWKGVQVARGVKSSK